MYFLGSWNVNQPQNNPSMKIALLCAATLNLLGGLCHAALVQPALTLTKNPSNPAADYSLGDGGHNLFFNLSQACTIRQVTFTVRGGFAFYSVANMTAFDVAYIKANQPFAGNVGMGAALCKRR